MDSVKRLYDGNVQAWHMLSAFKPMTSKDGKTYLSIKEISTYNCLDKTISGGMQLLLSGKMGKGEIVQSITSTTQFTPIVPDALEESAFKKVCNK